MDEDVFKKLISPKSLQEFSLEDNKGKSWALVVEVKGKPLVMVALTPEQYDALHDVLFTTKKEPMELTLRETIDHRLRN